MPGFAFPTVGRPGVASPPSRMSKGRHPSVLCSAKTASAHLRSLHLSLAHGYLVYSRLFVSHPIYYYRGRLVVLPRSNVNITPGLLVSRYTSTSGYLYKETGGSPKFPSYPYEYMPRS